MRCSQQVAVPIELLTLFYRYHLCPRSQLIGNNLASPIALALLIVFVVGKTGKHQLLPTNRHDHMAKMQGYRTFVFAVHTTSGHPANSVLLPRFLTPGLAFVTIVRPHLLCNGTRD